MDNWANAGGNLMGNPFELFYVQLSIKLDATFKNPIAADLANMLSDALEALGLKDFLGSLTSGSVGKDSIDEVVILRNAACVLRDKMFDLLTRVVFRLSLRLSLRLS
mgnify:CR=1 FL=1